MGSEGEERHPLLHRGHGAVVTHIVKVETLSGVSRPPGYMAYVPACSCGWRGPAREAHAVARVAAWVHAKNAALADAE